jgi:ATP-binding cassette subfamily C (CFTR/MRP) protein 1
LSCITYDRFDLPSSSAKENSIEVQNGNFFWDKDDEQDKKGLGRREPEMNLIDMNFNVKRGEFVAVVGGIGAGKSSLMYALLGEMKFKENQRPRVSISGSLSLVTQKPWIVNDTVKNNILFGERFDAIKYK